MPGKENFLVGGLIFLVGVAATAASYAFSSAYRLAEFTLATGAIGFGGLQMLLGLGQLLKHVARGSRGRARYRAEVGFGAVVRSMVSMAAIDGRLDDVELSMIQLVCRMLYDTDISDQNISAIHAEMWASSDISEELAEASGQMSEDDRYFAIEAMAMVGCADGAISQEKMQRLFHYGAVFGIAPAEVAQIAEKAERVMPAVTASARHPTTLSGPGAAPAEA